MAQILGSMDVNIDRAMRDDNYASAIKDLRMRLTVTHTRNRAVLSRLIPDETKGVEAFRRNVSWFDVVLHLTINRNPTRVRLRLRSDNLYLYGYRVNEAGNWFELRKPEPNSWRIDARSEALGFDHNYNNILTAAGYGSMVGNIKLGREELVSAAERLAGPATTPQQVLGRARGLITLIVMFAEAARLEDVFKYLKRTFVAGELIDGSPATPTVKQWMADQMDSWGKLSFAVLHYDQKRPDDKKHPVDHKTSKKDDPPKWEPQKINTEKGEKVLRTVDEVLQYVALLQRDPRTIPA